MKLARAKFLAWLRQQKPGRRFRRRTDCSCPLACFLDGFVTECDYYRETITIRPLPRWAKNFVKGVDASKRETITAAECIRLLSEETESPKSTQ